MTRKSVLMDELHITVAAPCNLGLTEYRAIHWALNRPGFRTSLNRAVQAVFRRYPSLAKVRLTITR